MCLIALALDQQRRFPLVIAANRDEFFDRPAARLAWWAPSPDAPAILAGRDLQAGGTWLGLNAAGRMAMLTNLRRPARPEAGAPSRGGIVPLWLRGELRADRFWAQIAQSDHNPFTLIAADFANGECWWGTLAEPAPRRLERGLYGLSNAALDTPRPKVERLKLAMRAALVRADSTKQLAQALFAALADRTPVADAALPQTGIAIERERELASAFIRSPELRYGTRCSTLVITERIHKRLVSQVFERTFSVSGGVALLRQASLRDWPPRYDTGEPSVAPLGPVHDAELDDAAEHAAPAAPRKRVRSLLKPAHPR